MKRAPYPIEPDTSGKNYWRSLDEFEKSPSFAEDLTREFPEGAAEPPQGTNRRQFLSIMGASMALGGLAACRRPEEVIVPYTRAPEEVIPGKPLFFSTAMPILGTAIGLVVETHEGRPTKIEGNPRHPESLGATNSFVQASVLDLYDPDRSQSPQEKGLARTWDEANAFLRKLGDDAKKKNGKGLAVLVEDHRSPTLAAQLDALLKLMPDARVVRYEAFGRDVQEEGARIAFGKALVPVYDIGEADVVVSLDADFLLNEGSVVKNVRAFAARRDPDRKDKPMNRFYAIESIFSVTGTSADHRLRLSSRKIPAIAYALAQEIAAAAKVELPADITSALGGAPALDPDAAKLVKAIAGDIAKRNGAVAIVVGRKQPAAVHALVHAVHRAIGAVGKTVKLVKPLDEVKGGPAEIAALAKDLQAGTVDTLLVLGGNPVFNAPADVRDAIGKAKTLVHVGTHVDETGKAAAWHLNRAHTLESWGDVRSEDGTGAIIQPLIAPMYGGKTDAEILEVFLGGTRKGYDLVRASWRGAQSLVADFERDFRRALHDGIWKDSAFPAETADLDAAKVGAAIKAQKAVAPKGDLEVVFDPDPHTWDGRYANNGWLQEMPDPMAKLTWGNVASLSPKTAKGLGVVDGDLVTVSANGASVTLPALVAPGLADGTILVTVGQGRTVVGRVGKNVGVDTGALRASAAFHVADGVSITKAGGSTKLSRTQEHFLTEGRPLVLEASFAKYQANPQVVPPPKKYLSLFEERKYDQGHAWGMTIDLAACVGCNACSIACQAENNIPIVGAEGVQRSREMHWLRMDRYFEGDLENPTSVSQPMMCVHCENAPCEEVCPVAATTHSPEGLNEMTYNRCIGTKYCANNCPFKVRRFNYHDYTKDTIEQHKMQMNPDVTVRSRGVMEKCTYCVQRINRAKISAKAEGRDRLRDGEVVTACQAACPAQAIHFGDLNDKQSEVAKRAAGPRGYKLLEELNIRPRTSYLAKIKNPNPELEGA
ncbi:TAT-variant-translocated molybdopterin oxidoreductase [Polyangium sp. 15x6]|uniref:TAT-variant-translocated molybdopterin oxidoreductase n=1 Tax=Polyangium sp. 15x6 TaxID=3042687 RepID=UPI00249A3966|nr:TAT-variant-translocated molybdopterin oxidoreductase [Polyangium sp. 15x6]MDI3290091.1 TAT-variant-translocated molybdopterin oxidoreductase [Polyangium sp. 15x6]